MKDSTSKGLVTLAVLIALALLGTGVYFFTSKSKDNVLSDEAMMKDEKVILEESMVKDNMIKDDVMVEKDVMVPGEANGKMDKTTDVMMSSYAGMVLAGNVSLLVDFNKADYDKATASGKLVILYFYADWCPLCKDEFPKMQNVFNSLTDENVIGFRVNYNDNYTDSDEKTLAKEFGVAYQHTKVFIKGGKQILKSPESWEESRYFSEISKFSTN